MRKLALIASAGLSLGLAAVLGPPSASAADVPGSTASTVQLPNSFVNTEGSFAEKFADRDWYRVRLESGESYAIRGAPCQEAAEPDIRINLRDSTGKIIRGITVTDSFALSGFEYRAQKTGRFFIEYREIDECVLEGVYQAGFSRDCTGGKSTTCKTVVGGGGQGTFAFEGDQDWYRVALQAGVNYLTSVNSFFTSCVGVRKLDGQELENICDNQALFTVPQTATYFLTLTVPSFEGSISFAHQYDFSLSEQGP